MNDLGRASAICHFDYKVAGPSGIDFRHRYQFLEGELIVMPSVSVWHRDASLRLETRLRADVRQHDLGEVFHAPST